MSLAIRLNSVGYETSNNVCPRVLRCGYQSRTESDEDPWYRKSNPLKLGKHVESWSIRTSADTGCADISDVRKVK